MQNAQPPSFQLSYEWQILPDEFVFGMRGREIMISYAITEDECFQVGRRQSDKSLWIRRTPIRDMCWVSFPAEGGLEELTPVAELSPLPSIPTSQPPIFTPTTEWQHAPKGVVLPLGLDIEWNPAGHQFARLKPPPPPPPPTFCPTDDWLPVPVNAVPGAGIQDSDVEWLWLRMRNETTGERWVRLRKDRPVYVPTGREQERVPSGMNGIESDDVEVVYDENAQQYARLTEPAWQRLESERRRAKGETFLSTLPWREGDRVVNLREENPRVGIVVRKADWPAIGIAYEPDAVWNDWNDLQGELAAIYARRQLGNVSQASKSLAAWRDSRGDLGLFTAMIPAACRSVASIEQTIEALLTKRMVTVIGGPKGIGKTTFATYMAACVASELPLCGLRTKRGRVIYITAEDGPDLVTTRLLQLADAMPGADNVIVLDGGGYEDNIQGLLDKISHLDDVTLIVVDPAMHFCSRIVETAPARAFIQVLNRAAEWHRCAVLLLHNLNKDTDARTAKSVLRAFKGSNEITNRARTTYTLHLEGEARVLTLMYCNWQDAADHLLAPLRLLKDISSPEFFAIEPPVIGRVGGGGSVPVRERGERSAKSKKAPSEVEVSADARLVAPIISAWEDGSDHPMQIKGVKSLYELMKGGLAKASEIADWSRVRCQTAHQQARDAGLVRPAPPKSRGRS